MYKGGSYNISFSTEFSETYSNTIILYFTQLAFYTNSYSFVLDF